MLRTSVLFAILLFIVSFSPLSAQQTYPIEFDQNGQLISAPPAVLYDSDSLSFSIQGIDATFRKNVIDVANLYWESLQNLLADNNIYSTYQASTDRLICEFGRDLTALITGTTYSTILNENINITALRSQLNQVASTCPPVSTNYLPPLTSLLWPQYELQIKWYDENGRMLLELTEPINEFTVGRNPVTIPVRTSARKCTFKLIQKNLYLLAMQGQLANLTSMPQRAEAIEIQKFIDGFNDSQYARAMRCGQNIDRLNALKQGPIQKALEILTGSGGDDVAQQLVLDTLKKSSVKEALAYYISQEVNCSTYMHCLYKGQKLTNILKQGCATCLSEEETSLLEALNSLELKQLINLLDRSELIAFYKDWLKGLTGLSIPNNISLYRLHQSAFHMEQVKNSIDKLMKDLLTDDCCNSSNTNFATLSTNITSTELPRLNNFINGSRDFVLHFQWLSRGNPLLNPFVQASPLSSNSFQRKALIKQYEALIAIIDQKLDALKEKPIEGDTQKNVTELTNRKVQFQAQVDSIESAIAQERRFENRFLKDSLLYEGLSFVSPPIRRWRFLRKKQYQLRRQDHYMFHHNAEHRFEIMNPRVQREFREDIYRPIILAHNLDKDDQGLTLNYRLEHIAKPRTYLDEDIEDSLPSPPEERENAGGNPGNQPAGNKNNFVAAQFNTSGCSIDAAAFATYKTDYGTLKTAIAFCKRLLKNGYPQLPLKPSEDSSPNYRSDDFPYVLSEEPTVVVNYEFAKSKDEATQDRNGNDEADDEQFSFRINKLFRFRFKLGVSYSDFTTNNYTIDPNTNQVTANATDVRGLDALFGLQVFFNKNGIDIRERGLGLRPYAFVGFPISKDVINETFLGLGSELLNGVGLTAGVHVKKNNFLESRGTLIEQNERWDAQPFVSILMDFNIFRNIFSFRVEEGYKNIFKTGG